MNYKEIQEKYPSAWELFINWDFKRWKEGSALVAHMKEAKEFEEMLYKHKGNINHYMYYFFDENEIYVLIDNSTDFLDIYPNGQWFSIIDIKGDTIGVDGDFNSRKEAEAEAFLKAFELLEQKLNGK